jgi:hypothetical protein
MEDDNYINPRHRHSFEQIRFKIHGRGPKYGRTLIDAGWLGYTRRVYYGLQTSQTGNQVNGRST